MFANVGLLEFSTREKKKSVWESMVNSQRGMKISNAYLTQKISGQLSLPTGQAFLKLFCHFFPQLCHGLFIFLKGYNLLDGLLFVKQHENYGFWLIRSFSTKTKVPWKILWVTLCLGIGMITKIKSTHAVFYLT